MTESHIAGRLVRGLRNADKSQLLKWTVYSLLLVNWAYYAFEEFYIASYTLSEGGTLREWAEEFATTIDEFAWFGLLFMFELETYVLEDDAFDRRRWLKWSVHGFRLVCYLFLLHTVVARYTTLQDTLSAPVAEGVTHLCQVADQGISFGENYRYETITAQNCDALTDDDRFYMTDSTVITDRDGYALEKRLAWVDLNDAIAWILVVWAIELAVRLQNHNITGGWLMLASHTAKALYILLFAHAVWWAWIGHWVWAWDEFLWIAGFWAIENNLSDWRDHIKKLRSGFVPQ